MSAGLSIVNLMLIMFDIIAQLSHYMLTIFNMR